MEEAAATTAVSARERACAPTMLGTATRAIRGRLCLGVVRRGSVVVAGLA